MTAFASNQVVVMNGAVPTFREPSLLSQEPQHATKKQKPCPGKHQDKQTDPPGTTLEAKN